MNCPFCNNMSNKLKYESSKDNFNLFCDDCHFHVSNMQRESFYSIYIDNYYLYGQNRGDFPQTILYNFNKLSFKFKQIINVLKYIEPLDYFSPKEFIKIKNKLLTLNAFS